MYKVKNELDWVYVLAHFNGICENCGYCDGGVCGGFTIFGVCKLLWGIPIRQVCKLSWNEGSTRQTSRSSTSYSKTYMS